ncbi:MAG: ATP-binding cassette domain-containing protein, partial [Clostridia bacterium]|nr:ATP-binding cassette domain-containing protein [Clostridia bacterium]
VKRHSFRSYYGMVLQESWLYNASVKDNVAYGKPDATMDEIIEACKLANAHAFIEKLPQGYDTIITERGDNISAGQKQLLCIARIMLLKPPMMILDEATSNIDTRTEMKIQEALNIMMEGRTCFIVAHRLSTIENADCILVMNKGHIIEQGTHKELLAKDGFYTKLFNSQFGN